MSGPARNRVTTGHPGRLVRSTGTPDGDLALELFMTQLAVLPSARKARPHEARAGSGISTSGYGAGMSDPKLPLAGGCMCGGVRFEVSEPLLGALYCHCKRCQRRTGTGFSVTALAAPGSYRTVCGEDLIRSWDPGNGGWIKSFCGECGSQISTTNPEDSTMVAIRMGALDEDPGIRPSVHQFVPFAAPWAPVPDDGLPRFPERLGTTPPEPA